MKTQDMIGRYAMLSYAEDGYEARGERMPAHLKQEMQNIATAAKARLSPHQMQSAMNHVEHAKLRFQSQEREIRRRVAATDAKENVDRFVKRTTAGMFGQPAGANKAQLDAYLNGKPIPSQRRREPTPEELDAAFRSATRQNDPKGVGWGKKETERRMDELADASPAEFRSIVKREGYRYDVGRIQQATSKWRGERIEQGLIERRAARDAQRNGKAEEEKLVPNDRDKRRAVLVQSYMDHTADQIEEDTSDSRYSEASDDLADRFSANDMVEPGRRGALARAWNDQLDAGGED